MSGLLLLSPIAFEAVQKFDAIFALERSINGARRPRRARPRAAETSRRW
jgi:hypothetical protein